MENDERERRDWPEEDGTPEAPESEGRREVGASDDEGAQAPAGEPEPRWSAPDEGTAAEGTDAPRDDETPPPVETESWPSDEGASPTDGSTRDHHETTQPWPTEPPAAESASEADWSTSAPERNESWERQEHPHTADEEPPPQEVEAYPAPAAETSEPAAAAAHSVPESEGATGESTQCPRCGTENRPGLSFCRSCGQRLVAAGVSSTVERPGAPEGTMACPRCGTHNRAGVAFCQNCGANLRGTGPDYVPPAAADDGVAEPAAAARGGAVLGPVVLLIGLAGLVTAYLLPFLYGGDSLLDRAYGANGYGVAFWEGYPDVSASLADQAYFGLAGPAPLLAVLLVVLAIAGFVRAAPGLLQSIGLAVALLWSVGLIVLFAVIELAGNWDGDIVGLLRVVTPAGIIFFLSGLIIVIGTLTRFARS